MNHVGALDGLRAIAVLIVMVSHAGLGHLIPGGFGVTIFFFLSGYLITTLMRLEIEKAGRLSFGGFYLRRTVRIIPPMLICIAVTVMLIAVGFIERDFNAKGLWTDILFLTNYAGQIGTNSNIPIPLWSLDVEEHFYLLFPALYVMARTTGTKLLLISSGIGLALMLRMVAYQSGDVANIFYWTHTRIDSILYGALLAVTNNPVTDDRARIGGQPSWLAAGIAIIGLTFMIRDPFFRETWRYSLQGIGLFLIFNHVLRTHSVVSRFLSADLLKWIGDRSYVLYLIHMPMILVGERAFGWGWAGYGAGFALSLVFAAAMYRFVEQPLLAWRRRFQERPRVPTAMEPKGVE